MQQRSDERIAAPGPVIVPRRRSTARSLAYGAAGFVLGAVFWHFVGFWDFVGHIMFKGTAEGQQEAAGRLPAIKLRERVSGVNSMAITLSAETCTDLHLDRATGQTRAEPCSPQALSIRSLRPARREDLWVIGAAKKNDNPLKGWSAVIVDASE